MQLAPAVVALALSPATAVGAGNQQTRQHRSSIQFPERGWQAGKVTISERVVSTAAVTHPCVAFAGHAALPGLTAGRDLPLAGVSVLLAG